MNNEEREARINQNPLFTLAPEVRMDANHQAARAQLVSELLKCKNFQQKLEARLRDPERTVLEEDKVEIKASVTDPAKRTTGFDGVAFTEAARDAIRKYDPTRGASFLTFFERLYAQKILQHGNELLNINESRVTTKRSKQDAKLLAQISSYRKETGRELTDAVCRKLAEITGTTPERILAVAQTQSSAALDADLNDEDDGLTLGDSIADTVSAQDETERKILIEEAAAHLAALDGASDSDRLFFSSLLATLLRAMSDGKAVLFCRALAAHEDALWRNVLHRAFLAQQFGCAPDALTLAEFIRQARRTDVTDADIAAYGGVSKGAVSQRHTTFRKRYYGILLELSEAIC